MLAFEFITKVKNNTIQVPKEFAKNLKDECRVIILTNEMPQKLAKKRNIEEIVTFKVKTKGLKIDREEANVRR